MTDGLFTIETEFSGLKCVTCSIHRSRSKFDYQGSITTAVSHWPVRQLDHVSFGDDADDASSVPIAGGNGHQKASKKTVQFN